MKFFDYVFYRVCKGYMQNAEKGAEGSAMALLSLVQAFNIFSILMLIGIIIQKKSILNKGIGLFILISLYVLNYIRYIYRENNNYQVLKSQWESQGFQENKGILVFAYISLSIISGLILAIYLGSKKV